MPVGLVDIVRQTLEEIAESEHDGFYRPIVSSHVDLILWLRHEEELKALGLEPYTYNFRVFETVLEKEVGLAPNPPFFMDWVQSKEDPNDGYYVFQIINNF